MDAENFMKKNSLKAGDFVEVEAAGIRHSGIIIPTHNPEFLVLKLGSGYNVSVKISEIKSVKKTGKSIEVGKCKTAAIKQNPALPKIAILHTGGTIAGRVDYKTGAIISSFEPDDLISMFPELSEIGNFSTKLVSNFLSGNSRFKNISKIAEAIEAEIKNVKDLKGIIIAHGTDTLGYTAAALSFMLENLPVPVVLVGAQRSSDRGSSDSAMNLVCASRFILKSGFKGTSICMHEGTSDDNCIILPAAKTRKMHTSRRDAFRPVNALPIAKVNYKTGEIKIIDKGAFAAQKGNFSAKTKMEEKVAILKSYPNLNAEHIDFFREKKYKGLVIEGTGMGHIATGGEGPEGAVNKKNLDAIKKLAESGCVVVMASQCIFGRVDMRVYSYGTDLLKVGVIPCEDMLAETAFMKLSWLLGNFSAKEVPKLMQENLRREMIERTAENTFNLEGL